jgi:hypothetical protein
LDSPVPVAPDCNTLGKKFVNIYNVENFIRIQDYKINILMYIINNYIQNITFFLNIAFIDFSKILNFHCFLENVYYYYYYKPSVSTVHDMKFSTRNDFYYKIDNFLYFSIIFIFEIGLSSIINIIKTWN